MCIDFASINKAYPKDCYPLPNIDRLVDSSAGYKVVDFLDAFQGYHRIFIAEEEVEKTTLIGWNMEIYADDMLIKSREAEHHEANLRKSFENLRRNKLRLNPDRCVFGVTSEKFVGYMISQRRIEVNPDKIDAVEAMQSPRTQKEAQCLTGRIAP
ncbi:hypothetical protein LIER_21660 [Lithospermum erythrorhizon]|uniref:Reverse transcriptase domain-containing protein n=1 Tax=Lithospermum erythrorhizon TaxID=34254 RepID=A0AAV3QS19_LITER